MGRYWEDWPPARPIRVDGGIKARSKRGAIGEQWWSRRFIDVLESYGMSGRLARGRSYARAGQVLDFKLSQGKVTARVQGSRVRPYQVRIGVLPLTTAQWRRVMQRLASQALFRAKLLAGEMPHEIEEVFAECGTPLFPRSAADLDMHCSCPDWGVPCKHLAAVCYVLAEEFDRDPFGMLAWRGKGRDELLTALRQIQPTGSAGRGSPGPGQAGAATRAALDVPASPLEECLEGFWSPGLSPARLRALAMARDSAAPDLLLRMFAPPPVQVRSKDLADVLAPAYQALAADDLGEPGQPQESLPPDGPPHPRQDGAQVTVVEQVRDDSERDDRAANRGHRQGESLQLVMDRHRQADGHPNGGACCAGGQPGQGRVANTL
jgi:uncharacterized Zn finger protein